ANLIKEQILELRDKGTSIIFSTHRMESVEELCEYIALIHKSEKILDGRLSDIKKAYKNNIFTIGLQTAHPEVILKEMNDKFQLLYDRFDLRENQLNMTLKLPTSDSKEILEYLGAKGNVNHFLETVPSANDIFIRSIKNEDVIHE
ncbi:MAG: DUF4162 domain-containing protein, partial [Maribacter sp.]